MAEYSKEQRVYGVFQSISEGYDSANNRISLGLQNSWKKTLTDRLTGKYSARNQYTGCLLRNRGYSAEDG